MYIAVDQKEYRRDAVKLLQQRGVSLRRVLEIGNKNL